MSPKKLFVIRPMGDPDSGERKRSDRIKEKFLVPAAEKAGYDIYSDDESDGLFLTAEIFRALEGNSMVVAYLGYPPQNSDCPLGKHGCPLGDLDRPPWNPNVLFEVGYRLATNKPLTILRHTDKRLPFDLYDLHCVILPPYDQLETQDVSRDERIVEAIVKNMRHRRSLSRLKSAYAVAEILIDHRDVADEDQESLFTASSEAADRIFHMEDSLIGRNIIEVDESLRPRLEGYQVKPFQDEQDQLLGRLTRGKGGNPNDIRAKVPFIFKASSVDGVHSPEYVDPEFRGRAFLAIIVQHRQLRSALSLRMLYFDVTGALKPEGGHFVCDLPKVARRIGETIQKIESEPLQRSPQPMEGADAV